MPDANHDAGCICHGNWRKIIAESEPRLNKTFLDDKGVPHVFFGVVHGSDDYYYGLLPQNSPPILLSCACDIEDYGFALVEDMPPEVAR